MRYRQFRAIPANGLTSAYKTPDSFTFYLYEDGEYLRDKAAAYEWVYGTDDYDFELIGWDDDFEEILYDEAPPFWSIDALIEFDALVDDVLDLDEYERYAVEYRLNNYHDNVQEAYDGYEDIYMHPGTLKEYAENLLFESGAYDIPSFLEYYIDVNKFAADLHDNVVEWEANDGTLFVVENT